MSDEFDIYGDDTFDLGIQSDDILGEIVGESTTREAKRQKLNKASNDDDLFEDFGEIDKKEKMKRTSHDRQNDSSQQQQQHSSSDNSSNTPKQTTSQQQQQPPLQKIPTTVSSTHTQSPRSTSGDSPSSRRAAAELPQAMASLRGIVTHPTTAFYLGELAWYVNDDEVKAPLVQKGLDSELKELTFFEQKVNGKSRGIVFLEFKSVDAAVKAKETMDTNVIDGKTPATAFTSSTNPFKHIPKETSSKSQRTPDTRMSGANTNRMMGNAAAAAGGGFNPMMPNAFNPAAFGNMNMNPYGGFNPMAAAAAAAARGGYMGNFENMMNMSGVSRGGRGGGGMAAMRNQQFMPRMGRGGPMMGGAGASGPAGNGGMYINPAFFEQQQQGGGGGGPGSGGA